MFYHFLMDGILIGFLASLPVGPISILIIQRTINKNRLSGFFSGLGAAISDTLYATVAGFGVVLIIGFIRDHEMWVRVFGALVLAILGILIFFSHPEKYARQKRQKNKSLIKYLGGTFIITFSNPAILFLHLAIFSGFGIVLSLDKPSQAIFVLLGFFIGAATWWFTLTGLLSLFRKKFTMKMCWWFNKIAGVAIVLFVVISLLVWFGK